jgi:hypothetical protein
LARLIENRGGKAAATLIQTEATRLPLQVWNPPLRTAATTPT